MDTELIVLIIVSVIFVIAAVFFFLIAYRQHKERGFIFTNKWLYASKREREEMDDKIKKTEYRFGRNVFFMMGIAFLIYAVLFQLWLPWLNYIGIASMVIICIYAIFQWIVNERFYRSIEDETREREW